MYPDPDNLSYATITPDVQELMGNSVLQQCDRLDGLEDGILNNPLACDVDVDQFACRDGETSECLSPVQLKAARRVYEGLVIDGEQVVPGYTPGAKIGENGWTRWITGGLVVAAGGEFQRGVPSDPEFPDPETAGIESLLDRGLPNWIGDVCQATRSGGSDRGSIL